MFYNNKNYASTNDGLKIFINCIMKTLNLNWSIKRAVVNFDDIEDEDTKLTLENVLKLCLEKNFDEAIKKLPTIFFEFDADSMDSDPADFFEIPKYAFELDPKNKYHEIKIGEHEQSLVLTISVIFKIYVTDDIDVEDFNDWLANNGGWYAGNASGLWTYTEDDGGLCQII
jgi:hypothetical protein